MIVALALIGAGTYLASSDTVPGEVRGPVTMLLMAVLGAIPSYLKIYWHIDLLPVPPVIPTNAGAVNIEVTNPTKGDAPVAKEN